MECTLYLSDDCNLKCRYCYEGHEKLHNKISKKTIEKAIDFIIKINRDDKIDLVFLGGEPMLNKEMMYYTIQYIKQYYNIQFNYSITTNGTCIEEKDIEFMYENKFEISLSVDGKRETHNLNRCAKNEKLELYDKIIYNINYMVKREIPFTVA